METIDLGAMKTADQKIRCVLYGQAACGKTHLMREFPKPLLLFDFDGKYEPLVGVEGISLVSYVMTENRQARDIIPRFWRDLQAALKDPKIETVVIDSLTAFDRILERWTVIMSGKGKDAGARATIQEYGDMKRYYRTLLPCISSVKDKNVVLIAHEQRKEDGDVLLAIQPHVTGKIANEIGSIFPTVFHMEHIVGAKERRVLHYKKHGKYACGSSSTAGGTGSIENPTYEKIKQAFAVR